MRANPATFLLFLLHGFLAAQTYTFKSYTEEEGLPQNYVYHISQDRRGALLCSTGEAVCAFDGYEFRVLTPKQLTDDFVGIHFSDEAGRLWVGHRQGGVTLLTRGTVIKCQGDHLAESPVTGLDQGKGNTIIASGSAGMFRIDTAGKIHHIEGAPGDVTCLFALGNEHFLAGTGTGVYYIELHANEAMSALIKGTEKLTPKQISRAHHFAGSYWMLTQENTIALLTRQSNGYLLAGNLRGAVVGDDIATCIMGGSGGGLWIGVAGKGALRVAFDPAGPLSAASVQTINASNGLSSDQIQTIFEDREGNIWFGTFGDGLILRPAGQFVYYGDKESLPASNVTAVLPQGAEDVWVGTSGGIFLYNRIARRALCPAPLKSLQTARVTSIADAGSGKIWIGTTGEGVCIYDTAAKKLFSLQRTLGRITVNCIAREPGRILIGTTRGLFVVNEVLKDTTLLTTNEGLLHNNVQHVFTDSKGRTWVSSPGAPPYFIANGAVVPFRSIKGLSTYNINAVCEDRDGIIWIATDGDGIFRYDGKKFTAFTTAQGLLSNYCTGILVDRSNTLWIAHKNGLSEKTAGRDRFIVHTAKRGLLFNQNNYGAVASDAAGNIWFGTATGLAFCQARIYAANAVKPIVDITSVKVNDAPYDPEKAIDMPYGEYELAIRYNAICLSDPSAIQYSYRISDSDTAWTLTDARSITFPKITDGKFNFEIFACNLDNGECGPLRRFVLNVARPVWKRAWFYIALFVFLTAVTYVIVQLRTRRLRKTQLMLQLKVKQKTFLLHREKQAVETIKVELEHKNKDITDSINYAKRIQDSILPPDELFAELFGDDYFVLFKPKDIVSGDFYWAAQLDHHLAGKNPLSIAAVVDCTGHGVPGAFLSIMANDFLRQSIARIDVRMPNQILDFVNASVSSHLNQTSKTQIRDGMDIALIAIDRPNMKLYFSGANNPIYIFRQLPDGVIDQVILTATKQSIGMVTEETVPFAFREFGLAKGDIIYLFSDGYADQFGGANNKKLSYKRFREILLSAFSLPMPAQKEKLDVEFEKWKGSDQQTDDVCVMGIRI